MNVLQWLLPVLGICIATTAAQTNFAAAPPKPPLLSPRRHFSWRRAVGEELIKEQAFAVDTPETQVVALISRDVSLAEAGVYFGSVSVYDFTTPTPVAAVKPYFQGQPCFLLPPPLGDFNSTLGLLELRNGAQMNDTGPPVEMSAGEFPISDRERSQVLAANPVLLRLCSRQPIFRCSSPDPLTFDPYLAVDVEQLTFSVLTLEGSATITFFWEFLTR